MNLVLMGQANLDSLLSLWQNSKLSDSVRVNAYNNYIEMGYLYSNPDTVLVLTNNLISYSKKSNFPIAEAKALRLQGIVNAMKGDYSNSESLFNKSLDICTKENDLLGIANNLKNLGNISIYKGERTKALDYALKALEINEKLNDKKGIASSLENLGNLYFQQEEFEKALEYGLKSLRLFQELGAKEGISLTLSNLGSIYWALNDYPLALEYNQKALEVYQEIGNKKGIVTLLSNNGAIYYKMENYPESLRLELKVEQLNLEMGLGYTGTNQINIGLIHGKLKNYSKAIDYCSKGLKIVDDKGAIPDIVKACNCLYENYKVLGKGDQALIYLEKKQLNENKLQKEETSKKLQQMEFEKKMLQDSIAKAEEARLIESAHQEEVRQKNKTRNMLAGGGLILFILAGGIYSRLRYTRKAKAIIEKEKDRSENLLLNILPADIAAELKEKGKADAREFDMVSIIFTDFKGFTAASEKLSAQDLVAEINTCFEAFDGIMSKYNIEKIKTIGDAYMAAGGLPVPDDSSIRNTVLAALEMQQFISKRKIELDSKGLPAFEMRVGVHTGPVVAGIVGVKKFQYDIWGDTVNTASRMESSGAVGKVNISQSTYELLKDDSQPASQHAEFIFESRGMIEAKGKGKIEMYFVSKK